MVRIPLFQRGFALSMPSGTLEAGAADVASTFIPQYVIYTQRLDGAKPLWNKGLSEIKVFHPIVRYLQ